MAYCPIALMLNFSIKMSIYFIKINPFNVSEDILFLVLQFKCPATE